MSAPSGTRDDAVKVSFAPDINPLLAEAFLEEAPSHAARFAEAVSRLSGERPSLDDVVQAQRIAHTLKGSASITGVSAIADLTHVAEDVLDWLADNDALPPPGLEGALVETADCVAGMVDALREGGVAPAGSAALAQRLRAFRDGQQAAPDARGTDPGTAESASPVTPAPLRPIAPRAAAVQETSAAAIPPQAAPAPTVAADTRPEPEPAPRSAAEPASRSDAPAPPPAAPAPRSPTAAGPQPSPPAAEPAPAPPSIAAAAPPDAAPPAPGAPPDAQPDGGAAAGAPSPGFAARPAAASLRVPVELVDGLLRLAGELAVSNVQSQGAHQRMTAQANALREQYHLVQQRLSDLRDLVEVRGVPSGQGSGTHTATGTLVQGHGFDPLEMDEYNELHSKTTALAEAMTDFCEVALGLRPELAKLDDVFADQQRISKELSDAVMSARMVPVGSIEARLQRMVRETCRATSKQARLELVGGYLPVDGDVLGALVDPLLHVLRNAVDHGIEAPEERERAGKPAEGLLRIAFSREGDSVLVQVSDDGRGFDLDRIRSVAHARGLLAEDEERTDRELLQLSVRPGFSTRETATQISGRGVGMDVVQRAVLDLKGSMDIASEDGAGATIRLRVPLTLISMHVLLVRSGGRVFGVPSGTLEQVLFSDAGVLADDGVGPVFTYEERDYRVHQLDALTGRPAAMPEAGGKALPMLLLEADAGLTAVVVDAAVDGRYLVVKSLGERVPRPAGVIGASILGDGSVAPVLDLREMLRHRSTLPAAVAAAAVHEEVPEKALAPEVLVVDDSLTARRMLSIGLADAGYRVRTAIDGLDAVEAIEESLPDLVVTDLEMPRMNGLELAAHLRGDARTTDLPVLMVTSRSTDKHRGQATASGINAFITKPYANEELLERVEELLATVGA